MGDLASMGPGQGPAHASYLPWIRVMLRCCNRPAVGCQWPHLLLFPSAPEWVPNLRCECVCPATPLHCHNKGSCWFSVSSTPGGESASRQEGNHSRKRPGVGTSACLRALALAQSVQCAGGIPCMDWQNPSPPLVPARVLYQGWLHIGQRRWRLPIGHGRGKDVIALVGAPANGFVRGGARGAQAWPSSPVPAIWTATWRWPCGKVGGRECDARCAKTETLLAVEGQHRRLCLASRHICGFVRLQLSQADAHCCADGSNQPNMQSAQ